MDLKVLFVLQLCLLSTLFSLSVVLLFHGLPRLDMLSAAPKYLHVLNVLYGKYFVAYSPFNLQTKREEMKTKESKKKRRRKEIKKKEK